MSAKEGIDHVGCIFTAQGFEFYYVGVIVGPDKAEAAAATTKAAESSVLYDL